MEKLEWLIPLIGAVGACVAFFLAKPERTRLAVVAVVIVVTVGAWEASRRFYDLQTKYAAQTAVHRRLIRQTNSFLNFISEMIFRASDGWLPKTEEQFFSQRSAELICRELNISRPAPVMPPQLWRDRINIVFRDYQQGMQSIFDQYALVLDAELVQSLDKVATSHLFRIGMSATLTHRSDLEMKINRPPLLCWGLEPLVTESLANLYTLYRFLQSQEKDSGFSPNRQWLVFPLQRQKHLLGESRFSPADLKSWREQYPSSPGPRFGRGSPNKGVLPHATN